MSSTLTPSASSSGNASAALALAGRLLMAYLFLPAGISKVLGFAGTVGYIASAGLPVPQLAALVALVSATLAVGLKLPTTPGTGQLSVGCGFPPPLAHWPQACIPLVLTGIVMILGGMRRGRGQALTT